MGLAYKLAGKGAGRPAGKGFRLGSLLNLLWTLFSNSEDGELTYFTSNSEDGEQVIFEINQEDRT